MIKGMAEKTATLFIAKIDAVFRAFGRQTKAERIVDPLFPNFGAAYSSIEEAADPQRSDT